MSIRQVLDNADKNNIASKVDEDELIALGQKVCEWYEDDKSTMKDWDEMISKGMDVAKFELRGKSYPWDDAANFKSSVVFEAVRDFGDRANTEILRQKNLVAVGADVPENEELEALAERVSDHMNYQINREIPKWRKRQGKAFYPIAAMGAAFKKTFYDPSIGGLNSEFIMYPDFTVNNKCADFDDVPRFIHIRRFTANDIFSRVATGTWVEFEVPETDEDDKDKGYYTFFECYCEYDLDDDGYAEPYIVTVHKESNTVVRVAPRYSQTGVYVQHEGVTKRAIDVAIDTVEELESNELLSPEQRQQYFKEDVSREFRRAKLVRIEAEHMLTQYNFIEPMDNTLLGLGFLHIMSGQAKGINKATNDLFNAGTLANLQFGFLSKEHRDRKKGPFKAAPGRWDVTNIQAKDLASSIQPVPIKEPSATLLQLNEQLKTETQALGTKTNIGDAMSPNVPAISVLGMLQEGIIPTSALIGRIVEAMSEEFSVIARLNAVYTDPMLYMQVTGDANADYETDYNIDTIDITPTANAQFSSQFQRVQLAQVEMETVPLLIQAQLNPMPVIRNFYEAIGSGTGEEIFGEASDEDKQRMEQMQAMQQQQLEVQQAQQQIVQQQLALAERAQALREQEEAFKQEKETIELEQKQQKLEAEINKIRADIVHTLELAETEQMNNQIDVYTRRFDQLLEVAKLNVQRDRDINSGTRT